MGVLPVVMTRNTFFRSISYPISGYKAPQSVLRTILMYQRCDVAKGVRRNVLQHPLVRDMAAGYEPSVATAKCPVDCFTTYVAVCSYARECVKGLYCF